MNANNTNADMNMKSDMKSDDAAKRQELMAKSKDELVDKIFRLKGKLMLNDQGKCGCSCRACQNCEAGEGKEGRK